MINKLFHLGEKDVFLSCVIFRHGMATSAKRDAITIFISPFSFFHPSVTVVALPCGFALAWLGIRRNRHGSFVAWDCEVGGRGAGCFRWDGGDGYDAIDGNGMGGWLGGFGRR